MWVTPEALAAWHPPKTGRRGRSRTYSDIAIETGHLLRLAFGRPWRQTEGLLRSLATLLGLYIRVPDHTTFSRRSPGLTLARSLAQAQRAGPVHVVIDSYGRRSLGETAVFRYKTIIGRGLRARTLPSRKTEDRVACSVLNRMTRLGMPVSQHIA